jgi:hypothetical protein
MKELFEKILTYIPGFLHSYVSILTGPRIYLTDRLSGDNEEYVKALTFVGVSFSIVFLLSWIKLSPEHEFWNVFIFGFIVSLLLIAFLSAILVGIGKLFGMRPEYKGLITYVCYLQGVVQLFTALTSTIGLMFIRTISDTFYRFLLLSDSYIHVIGAKHYIEDFLQNFEQPDPETEALVQGIVIIMFTISVTFSFFMHAVSWRALFENSESSRGKIVLSFIAYYMAKLLLIGA